MDKAYVIDGSYVISHGDTEANATALIEVTHFALDRDNGKITLSAAGVTEVGVGNIYGAYSYVELEITNTQLQDALDRAQSQIEKDTHTHWADGTDATPDYVQVTEEKKSGKGKFDRDYYLNNFPLPKIINNVSSAVAVSATAITVVDSGGFPDSGYLLIDSDKIQYTGKDTVQHIFLGCSDVGAVHSVGATVVPNVIEISTTCSGTKPSWTVLAYDEDFDLDYNTGKVHLFREDYDTTHYGYQYPPRLIPNRFRVTYVSGYDSIPAEIKKLCLMLAVKDIMHTAVRKALISGNAIDRIEDYLIDNEWIADTLAKYKSLKMGNV